MAGALFKVGVPLIVVAAVLYQVVLKDALFVTLGVGRTLQPITDFPYQCRQIRDPILQACEDMWLSETSRQLFLACSDPLARKQWLPNVSRLNASGRALDDAIIAMEIDKPKGESYEYRIVQTNNFHGINGDGSLHLVGFTGVDGSAGINFFVVNNRPSIHPVTGDLLDNAEVGANSTVERFVLAPPDAKEMKHLQTFAHENLATPNRVAAMGKNAFYVTNDHGPHKVGRSHQLSPVVGTGDVSYCTTARGCRTVADGLTFPNGLIRDPKNGYVYVPSSGKGGIHVYRTKRMDPGLDFVEHIPIPSPIDNLSQDSEGDIYIAALSDLAAMMAAMDDPLNKTPPSTVLRLTQTESDGGERQWKWEKVLEDAKGEVLPGTTTAVHDAKTGRIFLSGVASPFITVCEKK
ncbi:hypothetical protein KC340_g10904 [Hortaea werneckii]|nr:hypothetical protein KC342_g8383 [Hortaea werneckii]KAI7097017.1 hypothetical protein KC339_g9971 [Hortaea werneckii]KAI7236555.1 hypothetical protein KC365_g5131 [Hortaea werneckii]KAI7308824.1 hypothetical protein KC340_g10904 [Hortaea werneckii]KAI7365210.1 hypothetical protein KC354_g5060 [Hortaea werneckii]